MRSQAVLVALALILTPLGARAADLVVWWEEGFNPEEDAAVREIIAAFEQETGKRVKLDQPSQSDIAAMNGTGGRAAALCAAGCRRRGAGVRGSAGMKAIESGRAGVAASGGKA